MYNLGENNLLLLIDNKTNYLEIYNSKAESKNQLAIGIKSYQIEKINSAKFTGVTTSENMDWSHHKETIWNKIAWTNFAIYIPSVNYLEDCAPLIHGLWL